MYVVILPHVAMLCFPWANGVQGNVKALSMSAKMLWIISILAIDCVWVVSGGEGRGEGGGEERLRRGALPHVHAGRVFPRPAAGQRIEHCGLKNVFFPLCIIIFIHGLRL